MTVPSPPSRAGAIATLEPPPTPTPTPVPVPATPRPTATPLDPPSEATIRAASGTQRGAPNSYCWVYGDGRSECRDTVTPSQPTALAVKKGETVLLRIGAAAPPNEEKIRPFQGSRSGYPQQAVDPALETSLQIDLDPGVWDMDLCATWRGHGEPVCWLFKLSVS